MTFYFNKYAAAGIDDMPLGVLPPAGVPDPLNQGSSPVLPSMLSIGTRTPASNVDAHGRPFLKSTGAADPYEIGKRVNEDNYETNTVIPGAQEHNDRISYPGASRNKGYQAWQNKFAPMPELDASQNQRLSAVQGSVGLRAGRHGDDITGAVEQGRKMKQDAIRDTGGYQRRRWSKIEQPSPNGNYRRTPEEIEAWRARDEAGGFDARERQWASKQRRAAREQRRDQHVQELASRPLIPERRAPSPSRNGSPDSTQQPPPQAPPTQQPPQEQPQQSDSTMPPVPPGPENPDFPTEQASEEAANFMESTEYTPDFDWDRMPIPANHERVRMHEEVNASLAEFRAMDVGEMEVALKTDGPTQAKAYKLFKQQLRLQHAKTGKNPQQQFETIMTDGIDPAELYEHIMEDEALADRYENWANEGGRVNPLDEGLSRERILGPDGNMNTADDRTNPDGLPAPPGADPVAPDGRVLPKHRAGSSYRPPTHYEHPDFEKNKVGEPTDDVPADPAAASPFGEAMGGLGDFWKSLDTPTQIMLGLGLITGIAGPLMSMFSGGKGFMGGMGRLMGLLGMLGIGGGLLKMFMDRKQPAASPSPSGGGATGSWGEESAAPGTRTSGGLSPMLEEYVPEAQRAYRDQTSWWQRAGASILPESITGARARTREGVASEFDERMENMGIQLTTESRDQQIDALTQRAMSSS
jgi:hypothetical protein